MVLDGDNFVVRLNVEYMSRALFPAWKADRDAKKADDL
jgi:hypothetical protein